MEEMVYEGESILANPQRSLDEFGSLLHESWKLKRSLTNKITSASIDDIYAAGLSAGAIGGKLLGAGGGGFMLFFVPPERRAALRSRPERADVYSFPLLHEGQRRGRLPAG